MKVDYAVLIPSKTRPGSLSKLFKKCPALNNPYTFVGLEPAEMPLYAQWQTSLGNLCTIVDVVNPSHSPHVARQFIKDYAKGSATRYVLLDDNCVISDQKLEWLLLAQAYTKGVMSGTHSTGSFFHKEAIAKGEHVVLGGHPLTLFDQISFMFWCIPGELYDKFDYPEGGGLDDSEFALWAIKNHHFKNFKGCAEATYEKRRHELRSEPNAGAAKAIQVAQWFIALAGRYPEYIDPGCISTRVPYSKLLKEI